MSVDEVSVKEEYDDWIEWLSDITKLTGDWLYRGQYSNVALETTLELDCKRFGFKLDTDAEGIERQMIRQFQRVYDGDDRQKVQEDKLYCLSLMRHYGAPARLLDFTYSKYVAMYFSLESAYENVPKNKNKQPDYEAKRSCTVWCIDQNKLARKVECIPGVKELLKSRRDDKKRNDESFVPLYMDNKYKFAIWENPLQLHRRLHLQQGAFLCPGDIKVSLMDNLRAPYGTQKPDCIKKFTCSFTVSELRKAFEEFMRMDITRESLFPGLDGLGMSMRYQLWFYKRLHEWIEIAKGRL